MIYKKQLVTGFLSLLLRARGTEDGEDDVDEVTTTALLLPSPGVIKNQYTE